MCTVHNLHIHASLSILYTSEFSAEQPLKLEQVHCSIGGGGGGGGGGVWLGYEANLYA